MELEILNTLGFKLLDTPSLNIFVEFLLVKLNFHFSNHFEEIRKIIIYVTKMLMHDYSIIS